MTVEGYMEGKCLCGAIAIRASENNKMDACHCGMCRRWRGGPLLAVHCGSDIHIEGLENLRCIGLRNGLKELFAVTVAHTSSTSYYLPMNIFCRQVFSRKALNLSS